MDNIPGLQRISTILQAVQDLISKQKCARLTQLDGSYAMPVISPLCQPDKTPAIEISHVL